MTPTEQINAICQMRLCKSVKRSKATGAFLVDGDGKGRAYAHYNLLIGAVRDVLGSAIVRWNGKERAV